MTMDAYAPLTDPRTATLSVLVSTLAEDAMFALASGGGVEALRSTRQAPRRSVWRPSQRDARFSA